MTLRAGLLMTVALVGSCTADGPAAPSANTHGSAPSSAESSSIMAPDPGWLAVDLRFDPDVFLTEGSISFITVSDVSDELVQQDRSKDWQPHFRMQLAPGRYGVRTYRRPCDGSCRALDPPRDACRFNVEMIGDGSNRLVVVHVARDGACQVADMGDVLEIEGAYDVADLASFTRALGDAGYDVDVAPGDRWLRRFFLVRDRAVTFGDHELHVFEYPSVAKREQISISPDGTGISSERGLAAIIEWSPTHFYRSGKLLVLFLGDDPVVLEAMSLLLGPRFAGS